MYICRKYWITLLIAFFLVIGLIVLAGCLPQEQTEMIEEDWLSNRETWFYMGRRHSELDAIPGIDEPVIWVNGLPITRRTIEVQKINNIFEYPNTLSLEESIELFIRIKVVQSEAVRRGIHPPPDRVNFDLEHERKRIEEEPNGLTLAYIVGRGITIDEYILMNIESSYAQIQVDYFWRSIIELYDNEIQAEAIIQNRDPYFVAFEFRDRYIDELVENADIEILDPEIRELLQQ